MKSFIVLVIALLVVNSDKSRSEQVSTNELSGNWDFYWKELIIDPDEAANTPIQVVVPADWQSYDIEGISQFGYATYIKNIHIVNDGKVGIKIDHVFSAYELFVNGRQLYASGKVGVSKEDYEPYREPRIINIPMDLGDDLTIVLQAANYDHLNSGFYYEPSIGDYETLSRDLKARQGVSLFLAGGFFITGFILFGFSLASRQLELQVFFYSLFSLSLVYRMIGSSPYPLHALFSSYDFYVATRFEYLAIHTAALFGGLFIFQTFRRQAIGLLTRLFYIGCGISATVVLFAGPAVYTATLKYFLFFILFYVLVFVYTIVKAKIQKEPSSNYLVFALIIVFVWTLFQVITFMGIGTIPFWINVVLVSAMIVLCNVALFETFIKRIAWFKEQEGQLELANGKNIMMSLISHEIKVPVASLQMNLAMLKESSTNQALFDKIKAKTLNGATQSVESIKSMLNDFLFFMSQEGERAIEAMSIRAVVNLLKNEFDGEIEVHGEEGFQFSSHLVTLSYVVRTLVNNAYKHTNDEARPPEIHINTKGKYGTIEVRDFGDGISQEALEKLGKVNKGVSDSLEVEGMGFYLANELANKLGHSLKIEQNEFGGTSAFVILSNG